MDTSDVHHSLKFHYSDVDYLYDEFDDPIFDNNAISGSVYAAETKMSFSAITQACVIPTLFDICSTYIPVLLLCLFFQFINRFTEFNVSCKHSISAALGIAVLYSYFDFLILHCIGLASISYVFLLFASNSKYSKMIITIVLLSYLTASEFIIEGPSWGRIRNVQMLITMKIVSLIFDLNRNAVIRPPSLVQFYGYIFCVGNCIFGPWVNYSTYLAIYYRKKWHIAWLKCLFKGILRSLALSLIFFSISMCYLDWFSSQANNHYLIKMYLKALEFRTGHYFILFMSDSFALATGLGQLSSSVLNDVTNPVKIEFPRSLVEVVVFWNIPMHTWLKSYIFKPLMRYGQFAAVLGTYFISSLLHGLNFQLSGILISLAMYTYVEYVFRDKLARKLNACIRSKPCEKNCSIHKNTNKLISVRFANLFLTAVALYHLSYLGFLIDLQTQEKLNWNESFRVWKEDGYHSHFIAVGTFILSFIL